MEVAAGLSDVVLVGGAGRVLTVSPAESTEYFAYASDAVWEQPLGLTFPGVFALIARAHMEKHGTTEAQMAAVAVKNHRHRVLNPKAQFQKPITVDQVLKPPYVADPLKLLDCSPFSDGRAARVVAPEEDGRRPRRREGAHEPRGEDPGQSVGRSEGEGPSHRRDGRRADRGDRHAAARGGRPAPGRRRTDRPDSHPRRQHRHRAREPLRP